MAFTKEAIAIVLDVGSSMNQAAEGDSTYFQTSIDAINMILQRKLFAESKDEVALILCGTPHTANDLADGEGYEHISVARPLGMVDWDLLQYLQNEVTPSTISADFLDAIVVGMDQIIRGIQGKRGFASKRLILFSDLGGEFSDDNLDDIVASFKEKEIEFNIIGPDLDEDPRGKGDGDDGAEGAANGEVKPKTKQQRAGEALLYYIIEQVNGASYSFSEALPALSYFQSRQVRPTAWKVIMEIGPNLEIPVMGYIKVKEAKPKSYKNVYAKEAGSAIQRARTYHLTDEEETEIDQPDTVEGHRYGSTLVPFSGDDKEAMKFRATKGFKVLGFTKSETVKKHQYMGDNVMAFSAERGDEAAHVALSAVIQALYETNTVAIVRRVYSNATTPRIGVLTPHIKSSYECLFYNDLPFAEDVRRFLFGSLPVSAENTAANQKQAPSDEQLAAIDGLIDTMDLSAADKDEDGEAREALKPKLTFNPHLQHLYQCLQHRALNPDDPLPKLSQLVEKYLDAPEEVVTKSEGAREKVKKLFKLTEVVKKKDDQTGENMFKAGDAEAPAAKKAKVDDDLKGGMADLVKAKVTEVGTVKPIEDFKAIISSKEVDRFEEACSMMQKRILQIVMDSFGPQSYGKAMDCLKALRGECVKNSEPKSFNDFLKELKDSLPERKRRDFWDKIVAEKMTLITKTECEESHVTQEEASTFITQKAEVKEETKAEAEEDPDDLIGEME